MEDSGHYGQQRVPQTPDPKPKLNVAPLERDLTPFVLDMTPKPIQPRLEPASPLTTEQYIRLEAAKVAAGSTSPETTPAAFLNWTDFLVNYITTGNNPWRG